MSRNVQITDAEKFRRECEGRTQSERILDKFLLRTERQELKEIKKPSQDEIMRKKAMTSTTALFNKKVIDAQKKVGGDEKQFFANSESINKLQDQHEKLLEEEKKQQQEQQDKEGKQSVNIKEAISKILKHIPNKGKVAKAIVILHKLVIKSSQTICLEQSLDILLVLIQNRGSFNNKESKTMVKQIYLAIINENKDFGKIEGDVKYFSNFMDVYSDQVKILKIFFEDFIDIDTDDSFQFNSIVKKLQGYFDEIPEDKIQAKHQEMKKEEKNGQETVKNEEELMQQKIQEKKKQEKIESKEAKINSIRDRLNKKKQEEIKKNQIQKVVLPVYEYEISENLEKFINNYSYQLQVKVELIISLYKRLLDFYKNGWAKAIINQIYSDVQFNKKFIFEENVQKQLEDYGNQWMDMKNGETVKQDKINQMNSNIIKAGTSRTGFKDARSENIIMGNGVSTWGNRQNGL